MIGQQCFGIQGMVEFQNLRIYQRFFTFSFGGNGRVSSFFQWWQNAFKAQQTGSGSLWNNKQAEGESMRR
jgi:hypothetical protein